LGAAFVFGEASRFGEMTGEYGRNAQQIVSYHDISKARAMPVDRAAYSPQLW
jgi:hypothetical protein